MEPIDAERLYAITEDLVESVSRSHWQRIVSERGCVQQITSPNGSVMQIHVIVTTDEDDFMEEMELDLA